MILSYSESNEIQTIWYIKNVWSERYLNFKINKPDNYKPTDIEHKLRHILEITINI